MDNSIYLAFLCDCEEKGFVGIPDYNIRSPIAIGVVKKFTIFISIHEIPVCAGICLATSLYQYGYFQKNKANNHKTESVL